MHRLSQIFLVAFCISFAGQLLLLQLNDFTDQNVWEARIEQFETDFKSGSFDAYNPVYSGHPGTSILLTGILFRQFSLTPTVSLQLGVAIISSLAIAGATRAAAFLYRNSIWWIAVPLIATFHPLFLHASPTNAAAATLSLFVVLWALFLYRTKPHPYSQEVIIWGIAIGVLATTRLPTALLIATPFVFLLASRIGFSAILAVFASSTTGAILLNPFLWFEPINHLSFVLFRSSLNLTDAVPSNPLTINDFILFAPLSLLSIGLTIFLFIRKHLSLFPRGFTIALALMTALFSFVFLRVEAQSLRHFLPLIYIWEVFFIQIVIHLLNASPLPHASKMLYTRCIVGAVVFGQAFLLLYVLWP